MNYIEQCEAVIGMLPVETKQWFAMQQKAFEDINRLNMVNPSLLQANSEFEKEKFINKRLGKSNEVGGI